MILPPYAIFLLRKLRKIARLIQRSHKYLVFRRNPLYFFMQFAIMKEVNREESGKERAMLYPEFLEEGCTIGVTACSDGNQDPLDFVRVDSAKLHLEERGYRVVETPNVRTSRLGRSSSARERAGQLNSLLLRDDVRLIIMAKGGDYLPEMLPLLDFEMIKRHPKWIQGYSDPTGLLFSVTTNCDIATVYASNFGDFGMAEWHKSIEDNVRLLEGKAVTQTSFEQYQDGFAVRETGLEGYAVSEQVKWKNLNGEERVSIEGRLLGGCLDVLVNLVGTRYDKTAEFVRRYREDKILWYLESFNLNSEQLYLGLWQLKEAGWFENAAGFVFGRPCMYRSDMDLSYEEVIREALKELEVPVILDADIGHKPPRMTIINGAVGRFVCEGGRGSLTMRFLPETSQGGNTDSIGLPDLVAEQMAREITEEARREEESGEEEGRKEPMTENKADEPIQLDHIAAEKKEKKTKGTGTGRIRQYAYLFWFPALFVYLEAVFHLFNFKSTDHILFPILFAVPFGLLAQLITGLFKGRARRAVLWVISSVVVLIFAVQHVYYYIFRTFLVMYSVGAVGTDVLEYWRQIIDSILAKLPQILLIVVLPLAVFGLLCHFGFFGRAKGEKAKRNRRWKWQEITVGAAAVALYLVVLLMLPLGGRILYSPYDLYHENWMQDMGTEKLGLLTASAVDLKLTLFGGEEISFEELRGQAAVTSPTPVTTEPASDEDVTGQGGDPAEVTPAVTPTPTPTPVDRSPNVLEIDFAALAETETNPDIQTLHEYFASVAPTRKNEYTGMFEGYNLIMLTAEGFSPWAVDEEVTPTLYKLTHEGFVFNNFYTALWWTSTSDGEYVACTGLIPSGSNSMKKSAEHSLPFCLGWQFGRLGYQTKAYHNHTYTYYGRDKTHPNMGYDYKGVGNGLEVKQTWPESDLEMIEVTAPEYIGDEPFHVYYMTVSGHMQYTFIGNSMSTKNRDAVADLPYSEEAKAYIACNVELDRALERLIELLTEAGVADKTVIALSSDHYPYGLEKDKIDELAGHEVDENFEIYKNHFILWSAGMDETIVIDKPCSSLDILPTLSNLFGLPYDSRLLMGRDILSDAEPLVILSNRSFITDKVMYNSRTGETIPLTEEELPEDYVRSINAQINAKFTASAGILQNDYYSTIDDFLFPDSDAGQEQESQ